MQPLKNLCVHWRSSETVLICWTQKYPRFKGPAPRLMPGARFPCSSIVSLPAAAGGKWGGGEGALMGGPPHMVPHSCGLRPTSDSSGSQLGRSHSLCHFNCNNLGLQGGGWNCLPSNIFIRATRCTAGSRCTPTLTSLHRKDVIKVFYEFVKDH